MQQTGLRSHCQRAVWAVLCLTSFLWAEISPSLAQAEPSSGGPQISVGIDETFKIGCWTEVAVSDPKLEGGYYQVQVQVLDADGNYASFESEVQNVTESAPLSTRVPVRVGRIHSDILVRIFQVPADDAQPKARQKKLIHDQRISSRSIEQLTQSQPWIVAVGQVNGIEVTTEFVRDLKVTHLNELTELPARPLCWQGVNVLFISAADFPAADLERLKTWVYGGGSLVVIPNQPAAQFLELPLTRQLPVTFDGVAQVRDLSRLVSFVGEPSPLRISSLTIPRIVDAPGKTLVGGLSGSIVTLSPWGLGQVTVLAVNLNDKVFQSWQALPQLYRLLAQLPSNIDSEAEAGAGQLTQNGLTDFKTQWDAALAEFGVETPSVWLPLGSLLLAALLVGPIDYFLVRHLLKKPWLTWITFPALVVVAAVWGLADNSKQATRLGDSRNQVLGNQCVVIDYSVPSGTQRHQAFVKLLVPETGRYRAIVKTQLPLAELPTDQLLGPGAVPEPSFRGYYRPSGTHLDQTAYQVQPEKLAVTGLPIYEHSTALLEVIGQNRSESPAPSDTLATSNLQSTSTNQLRGNLTLRLEQPVTDWLLAYGKLLYFVDQDHPAAELDPGETLELSNRNINQKELTAYLTGTTTTLIKRKAGVGEDLLVKRVDYNPFAQDLDYILKRLTFHRLLGERTYTSLTNVELTNWDFSRQLELNQAVLIGRLKQPAMSTQVDSAEIKTIKNETFVRMVFPVSTEYVVPERLPEYNKNGSPADSGK